MCVAEFSFTLTMLKVNKNNLKQVVSKPVKYVAVG